MHGGTSGAVFRVLYFAFQCAHKKEGGEKKKKKDGTHSFLFPVKITHK